MFKIMSFNFIGFLLSILCSFENKGYAQSKTHDHLSHFHNLQIASLKPSNTCHHSIEEGPSKKVFLKVVQKHGPCSQHEPNDPMGQAEMLLRDESRVNAIQSKLWKKSNDIDNLQGSIATDLLPVLSGRNLDSASNYIITVGFGTPRKEFTLIFDTFHDLTWTQCQPCYSCYKQIEPIFLPSDSSSYSTISCNSNLCTHLESPEGCTNPTCKYNERYGEDLYSIGTLSKERLSLTPTEVIHNFVFGCGQNNRGFQFGTTAGLLGLGRHKEVSFVQQTAQKYNRYFSYCLPSNPSLTGHLSFGHNGQIPKTIQFTPISTISKTNYGLDMTGISIGDKTLSISPIVFSRSGMIIDSGSVITRLPPAAYKVMREEFKSLMYMYPQTNGYSSMDTCYDLRGFNSIRVPKITFYFENGIEVELDESAILFRVNARQFCFAFATNKFNNQIAIFGSYQQKTLGLVYDVGGERIGFASNACP